LANTQWEIMEVTDVWQCPEEKEHIWTEDDDVHEPLYECADCGVFSRRDTGDHRCPECNKFGAKVEDYSCPEGCDEPMNSILAYKHEGTYYISIETAKGEDV
jgi:hypothetical protein